MSIKIISNTMTEPIKCICNNCESVFTYTYEDIQRREESNFIGIPYTRRFVICPVCKYDICLQKAILNMTEEKKEANNEQ